MNVTTYKLGTILPPNEGETGHGDSDVNYDSLIKIHTFYE